MSGKYDEIINLPHFKSPDHPPLTMAQRAAQFAPFAALTGYGDLVRETGRLTEMRPEINEEDQAALDRITAALQERIREHPEIEIEYFEEDGRKEGGAVKTACGAVRKIDLYERIIVLQPDRKYAMDDILKIRYVSEESIC